jgi:hypothetical protein
MQLGGGLRHTSGGALNPRSTPSPMRLGSRTPPMSDPSSGAVGPRTTGWGLWEGAARRGPLVMQATWGAHNPRTTGIIRTPCEQRPCASSSTVGPHATGWGLQEGTAQRGCPCNPSRAGCVQSQNDWYCAHPLCVTTLVHKQKEWSKCHVS